MTYDLVVSGGLVVSTGGTFAADVAVDGERIAAIGVGLEGARVIDATGCYVLPGAVDPHVHLQLPLAGRVSADTFESGTRAALFGGTTTVIDFVTPNAGQTLLGALRQRREEADTSVACDYGLHMTLPTWHASSEPRLAEAPEVAAQGCATFKMYQAYDGMELDDVALLRAMRAVAATGGRVVLHSEVGPIIDQLRSDALSERHVAPIWHERTRPAHLEASAVQRALSLASLAGVPVYVFHVGAAEVVETVRRARRSGQPVYAETCPQYLLLTADTHLAGRNGELYICAPPLRGEADQASLWRGLERGVVDVVSTDHCPWTRAEKAQPAFTDVPGGVPSIEARLSLVHQFGVRSGSLSLERWVDVCCTAPARLMGLARKGRMVPGFDADLVVFDPAHRVNLTSAFLHEAADWTPYEDMEVMGWPRTVILRGRVAVDDGEIAGERWGKFVKRKFS